MSGGNQIPRTADGADHLAGKRLVDLGSQAADMDLDDVRSRIEMELPNPFQQHRLGDDAAGIAHQVFEHAEFLRLQFDGNASPADGPSQQVHLEIANLEADLLLRGGRTTPDGVEAGKQLGESEGLEEIVVGSGLQAFDAIIDAADGSEKEDRSPDFLGAQRAHQGQPVEDRQHSIDDHDVVAARQRKLETIGAALYAVRHMALLVQSC